MGGAQDRSARALAVLFLTAQFRAAGLAVVAMPLLPLLGAPVARPDGLLMTALALLAVACAGVRALVNRDLIRVRGLGMTLALLLLAAVLTVCIQRTGGLLSPLVLLLGTVAVTGALTLTPLAHFQLISGICMLCTLMVIGTTEGVFPADPAPVGFAAPFTLLVVELGLVALVGFLVNYLAWRLREQQAELTLRDIRDAQTGALRRSFFHAGLVALLDQAREGGAEGVTLLVVDLGDVGDEAIHEAGAILRDSIRGDDVVGRVAHARFAVAMATMRHEGARRLLDRLRPLNRELEAGVAQLAVADLKRDTVESARKLYAEAEEKIRKVESGFAIAS